MAKAKNDDRCVSARVYATISTVVAVLLLLVGVALCRVSGTVVSEVNKGLTAQKIYFPPKDSPAFNAQLFPDVQKYAGLQVTDGLMAKAYSDDYLGVQLAQVSGGKTLSEVSAEAMAAPQDVALMQKQQMLFQGETSRGFLAAAHGAWTQGVMLQNLGKVAFMMAAVFALVAVWNVMRYKKA